MTSFRTIVVPHTHWDREWYLPVSRLRQRLVGVLDDVLRQLEREPTLTFHLDGQVSLVDDYLDVRPERRGRVGVLVGDGRLAIGPWYVLADELLAGDESLVRNLLVGRRRAADLGGWLPVGYSPDAFGHPATLPAILRGFGIGTAVLWRGYGGESQPGSDLFTWEGPDGCAVLVHHLPPAGYEYGAELPEEPAALKERWDRLRGMLGPRAAVPVLLVLNGADHHALQPDLPSAVRRLEQLAPEHDFEIGTLATYFERVQEALSTSRGGRGTRRSLPTARGELRSTTGYAWTLQGVHATRAGLKRRIAEGTALLTRWSEPQAALAAVSGGQDRRALLEAAWRHHLVNLSHDVLAGCVADEVAADAATRARGVAEEARGLLDDALLDRLGQDLVCARGAPDAWKPSLVLVNPTPRPRGGVVEATVAVFCGHVVVGRPSAGKAEPPPGFALRDPAGRPVPFQVLHAYDAYERLDSPRAYPDQDRVRAARVALRGPATPALGLLRLDVCERAEVPAVAAAAVSATRAGLRAPWGTVRATRTGFEVRAGDRVLRNAARLISERDEGDSYTFEPVPRDRSARAEWGQPRVAWGGPLVAAVARDFAVAGRVRGTAFVRVDAESSLIRFAVEGANLAGNHRLRMVFPVQARGRATADMPYGPVTRPLVVPDRAAFPREWPVAAGPMHRFVTGGSWTVMTRGLFEYELLRDGSVAVTLFRAVGDLSRGELRARPGHAGWPVATPEAQERGPFRVELAVAPVAAEEGGDAAGWEAVEAAAEEFHAPLAGRMLRYGIDVPAEVPGPELVGEGFAFKALKPRDDAAGIVLRCVNLTDAPQSGAWRWPGPLARAFRARLDETVVAELPLAEDRSVVRFAAGPREIVTVILEP